jgi:hypothetical protein
MNSHHMRRRVGFLLVASACAALASCIPVGEPLSDAAKAEADKDVVGTWVREDDAGTRIMMIGRHESLADGANTPVPPGVMSYERLLLTKDGRLSREGGGGVFFVSRIKGEKYANVFDNSVVQAVQKQGSWSYPTDTAFYPIRYVAAKNTLTIVLPDADKVKAAINKGAIKGTVKGDDVKMDGGKDLADYLAKEGAKGLFTDEMGEKWQRAKVVPVK